jgi:hypothetical protein
LIQRKIVAMILLSAGEGTMMKALGVATLMLLALSGQAAANCAVPRFRTFANQTVDGFMAADSGRPCAVHFHAAGPRFSVDILQRPSHGTVQIGTIGSVIYRSKVGYAGNDSFTFERRGLTSLGAPAVTTTRMAVMVTPERR